MSFAKSGLSPVMEKIVNDILENNGSQLYVKEFRSSIYKMRFNEEDTNLSLIHI